MSSNKGLLSGLFNDEMRSIGISSYNNNNDINNNDINNNLNNISKSYYSEKYQTLINRPQTIKDNLGIIYNDDSIAQQSLYTEYNTISHEGLNNLDTETRYVIISGEDRPWYNNNTQENTFNFHIDCGDISLTNNNQVSSANIKHTLENVISIYCDCVIIPNRLLESGIRPTQFPFLQLSINDIEHTSFGTNKSLDNVLAILTPKIPLPNSLQDISYLEFINTNKQTKIYYTPKARLNKLSLSLKRYDGNDLIKTELLSQRDVFNIKCIYYDINMKKLLLETENYFNPDNFKVGDVLKIKNYVFRETNLEFQECYKFNNYINRDIGHTIVSVSRTNITDTDIIFNNVIELNYPRTMNLITGKYEIESWFQSLLDKTSLDNNIELDNNGILINTFLQIQVLLNIKIINKHSSRLIKNIDSK